MKREKTTQQKTLDFLAEYWIAIVAVLFFAAVFGLIIWEIARPKQVEGYVTNKMHFPGYSSCTDGDCHWSSERWIVSIQNGDEFDSWYVSESYYDSVHIGDFVRK